jgi:hypothetical protein
VEVTELRLFKVWSMGFIQDEKQSEAVSQKLNAILNSPMPFSDDMKIKIVQIFADVNNYSST